VLTGISMSDRLYRFLKQVTHRIRLNRVVIVLQSLHNEYVALSKSVRALVWFFVLSIVNQLIRTLMCVPLLTSLGVDVNLLALFAILPLSKAFIQFMPVPAGIGVAEGATVAALTLAHVSAPQALVVALVLRAVELATLVPSGLAYLIDAWPCEKPHEKQTISLPRAAMPRRRRFGSTSFTSRGTRARRSTRSASRHTPCSVAGTRN